MRADARRGTFPELEAAIGLGPAIRAAQDDIDADRELPRGLVESLTGSGLFRLLLPQDLGGSELPFPKFIRCVEAIAEADGSTGWCVGQGGVFPNVADKMCRETAEEIWLADPAAVVATGTPSGCTALPIEGGYRLSGRWRFASGCLHASWLAAMSPIVDDVGKATGFGMFLVPRDQIDLHDGWNVRGLRGTGSREYTLSDFEVPDRRALMGFVLGEHCGVATGLPSQLLFASAFGSVGLGISRRAIDSLIEIIEGKTPAFVNRKLIDDDLVHAGLAQAEGKWGAARAYLHELAEACTYEHREVGEPSAKLRAHLRLAATSAIRQSAEVVDKAYELAGSDAIFEDHPMHRCFQDMHAVSQQVQGRPAHFRTVGRVLLGLEPDAAVV
ncbi:MAG: acyl-CoA dehydrogenase family protein [Pseudomonadota bacterium]